MSSGLSIDGTAYTLVNDLPTFIADVFADHKGAYALAGDYDASADGSYSRSPVKTLFFGQVRGAGPCHPEPHHRHDAGETPPA